MDGVENVYLVKAAKYVAAALCMALGGLGPALSQGYIGGKSCESMGKSPDVAGVIRWHAVASMLIIETSTVFAFIIAIMLITK